MSADNMLVCSPVGDKWWVTQEFASNDTMTPVASHNWKLGPFNTKEAALMAAFEEENKGYYEYGTTVCETQIPPVPDLYVCKNCGEECYENEKGQLISDSGACPSPPEGVFFHQKEHEHVG